LHLLRTNVLYRNNGDGTFSNVTKAQAFERATEMGEPDVASWITTVTGTLICSSPLRRFILRTCASPGEKHQLQWKGIPWNVDARDCQQEGIAVQGTTAMNVHRRQPQAGIAQATQSYGMTVVAAISRERMPDILRCVDSTPFALS